MGKAVEKCLKRAVERTLTIRIKGKIKEINAYCSAIGELANSYNLEVEFK